MNLKRAVLCRITLAAALCSCQLWAVDWKPVLPEDLKLEKPRVEPNADAECLFWETWVSDALLNGQDPNATYTHYKRIKIFTDGGVKKFGTVDLEYEGKHHIGEISGRTIEPDGSIIELKKDAVFDHVIEKAHKRKVHAVSFAMPGVKPGAILEYRYKVFTGELANYIPLEAQMEIPVEHVTFHIKPLQDPRIPYHMSARAFNIQQMPFKNEPNGFYTASIDNIPAYREEEDAPPDREVRPWLLIYYAEDFKEQVPDKFWKAYGKSRYSGYKEFVKVNGDLKRIAEEEISGAKSDDEKLNKLYAYCQKHIKSLNGPDATDADRQAFKGNKNTADVVKHGVAWSGEVGLTFLALAEAAGFEAHMAYLMDRELMIFHKDLMVPYLPVEDVAVNVGGKWKFYDPATRYLEPGKLRWQEEGTFALLADGKDPQFVPVPVTPAAESRMVQKGRLKLDEDGNVEGDLHETLTGHLAEEFRREHGTHSKEENGKAVIDELKRHLPGGEISNVEISDLNDLSKPVEVKVHVKEEGYATRTGKRLFFTPAVFQVNEPARYSSSERKYDIYFHYPWSEVEDVSVEYPEGYNLDHADVPGSLDFQPIGAYKMTAANLGTRIMLHRELAFGVNGAFFFGAKGYPTLKKLFDAIHDSDAHMLTLMPMKKTMASKEE